MFRVLDKMIVSHIGFQCTKQEFDLNYQIYMKLELTMCHAQGFLAIT